MTYEALQKEKIAAMKAKDNVSKDAISILMAAVKKEAIDKGIRENIPEDMVDAAILKEVKLAKEQLDTCPDDRAELKAEYQARYDCMKSFAPAQMSEAEVEEFIRTNFADIIASGNKGALMKAVMPALKGKADGKMINQIASKIM